MNCDFRYTMRWAKTSGPTIADTDQPVLIIKNKKEMRCSYQVLKQCTLYPTTKCRHHGIIGNHEV